jgi:hypothetical protein
MSTEKNANELTVEDDLAEKTQAEVEEERRVMAERAERVRRRLTMNHAFLPSTGHFVPEQAKKPDVP